MIQLSLILFKFAVDRTYYKILSINFKIKRV